MKHTSLKVFIVGALTCLATAETYCKPPGGRMKHHGRKRAHGMPAAQAGIAVVGTGGRGGRVATAGKGPRGGRTSGQGGGRVVTAGTGRGPRGGRIAIAGTGRGSRGGGRVATAGGGRRGFGPGGGIAIAGRGPGRFGRRGSRRFGPRGGIVIAGRGPRGGRIAIAGRGPGRFGRRGRIFGPWQRSFGPRWGRPGWRRAGVYAGSRDAMGFHWWWVTNTTPYVLVIRPDSSNPYVLGPGQSERIRHDFGFGFQAHTQDFRFNQYFQSFNHNITFYLDNFGTVQMQSFNG